MDILMKVLAFVVYFIAVLVMSVAVVGLIGGRKQKKRCLGQVEGVVSRVKEEVQIRGKNKVKVYCPEFRYEVYDKTFTQKAPFTSMKKEYEAGQAITIHYDPKDPNVYYVGEELKISAKGGIICFIIGMALIFLGTSLMF